MFSEVPFPQQLGAIIWIVAVTFLYLELVLVSGGPEVRTPPTPDDDVFTGESTGPTGESSLPVLSVSASER